MLAAVAQEKKLNCDSSLPFGDRIEGATILAQNEKSITFEVKLLGFEEEEYFLIGIIQRGKSESSKVKGITTEKVKVPKGGGTVEITFNLNENEANFKGYTLQTKYVKFVASKSSSDGFLSDIDLPGMESGGGFSLFSKSLLCNCVHTWESDNIDVNSQSGPIIINLVPYGDAKYIK